MSASNARNVIIFGSTGAVGSAAARTAHQHGARVSLAMRDISKPIPGLNSDEEHSGRYDRVYADLGLPDSISAAVAKTGAAHAFIYAALGSSSDHLRASIEALKAAGIQSVVLLSSCSVRGDIRAVQPSDFIAFAHAQVEISLEEVFGPRGYVAVRPAFFASNSLWWRGQILEDGEVKWPFPELELDYISPEDIGAVCGTILAGAVEDTDQDNAVFLFGPETLTVTDAVQIIGKAIQKEAKVTKVSEDEGIQVLITKSGMPEPLARVLVQQMSLFAGNRTFFEVSNLQQAKGNIERYLKRPPMRFYEWVERNEEKFQVLQ